MMRGFSEEGRTVVFATHHLDEVDAVADRIVVMRRGAVVANGAASTIKAAVPTRRVRFVVRGADPARLRELDGVDAACVRGSEVVLDSLDADATVRALVASGMAFSDIEVTGADLEQAFVALTCDLADAQTVDDAVARTGSGDTPERYGRRDGARGLPALRGAAPGAQPPLRGHQRRLPGGLLHPLPPQRASGRPHRRDDLEDLLHGVDGQFRSHGGGPQRRRDAAGGRAGLGLDPSAAGHPPSRRGATWPPRSPPPWSSPCPSSPWSS